MSPRRSADYLAKFLAEHGLQPSQLACNRSESDVYVETNDVERGVTFTTDQEWRPGFSHTCEECIADKSDYMEESSRVFTSCDNEPKCGNEAAVLDEATAEQKKHGPLEKSAAAKERESPRFEYSDEPPKLQEETKRQLELTSLHLEEPPVTIGNQVLDLFRKKLSARVNKVNRKKFTIKAEVVHNAHAFTVKVRIYRYQHERSTGTVLEFQRRSGDIVAFRKVYRKVVGHLKGYPCDAPDWDISVPDEIPHAAKEGASRILKVLCCN